MRVIEYTIAIGDVWLELPAKWAGGERDDDAVQSAGERIAKGMCGELLFWHYKPTEES